MVSGCSGAYRRSKRQIEELIRARRSGRVAKELLGAAFAGILVSDRWSAYPWVDVARRQLCWAHRVRQFRGFQRLFEDATAMDIPAERAYHPVDQEQRTSFPRNAELHAPHVRDRDGLAEMSKLLPALLLHLIKEHHGSQRPL
jgi:Transposase IS66 family